MKLPTGSSYVVKDTNLTSPFIEEVSHVPPDNSRDGKNEGSCSSFYMAFFPLTYPNTGEREWVYYRVAFIHLLCIHVFANILALVLILFVVL
jgi:hypothetical protein